MLKIPENERIWKEYEKGLDFNAKIGLDETVKMNENFFIGRQWEGIEANGLPTPVFNFLKRVVLFTVASVAASSVKMVATPMGTGGGGLDAEVINAEFEKLFEINKIGALIREFLRNAAVDGDGCMYTYWDSEAEANDGTKGRIVTEIVENTQVFFGNASDRQVQRQPYIIVSRREMLESARKRAKENGIDAREITADADSLSRAYSDDSDKVTVLIKFWRNPETKTVWATECVKNAVLRPAWDTGLRLYPVTWLNWDYIQGCYHGQAMITGLIPNQVFINKMYAMSMISLMTTAYPKIVYDKTRIARWDNRVGAAIPVQGGDVNSVARIIDPAQISPQIAQFIDMAVANTQAFLGATNAALGEIRPDNASAIIAVQKAAAVPNEITRQNLHQSIEDLGRIYIDFMGGYYGKRPVCVEAPEEMAAALEFAGAAGREVVTEFDFRQVKDRNIALKLDVGASAYWSEITEMQTLDNLLVSGQIGLDDYLERLPDGHIARRQELLEKVRAGKSAADLTVNKNI